MNAKFPLIVSIAAVAFLRSTALANDTRFDGVWVGTESVTMVEATIYGQPVDKPFEKKTPAKIVIAQGGTLLGVLEGYGPGRYSDVKRVGFLDDSVVPPDA